TSGRTLASSRFPSWTVRATGNAGWHSNLQKPSAPASLSPDLARATAAARATCFYARLGQAWSASAWPLANWSDSPSDAPPWPLVPCRGRPPCTSAWPCTSARTALLTHRVCQAAEALGFYDHRVADLEKPRRVQGKPATGAGASGDDVAGFQRDVAGDLFDNLRNGEQHLAGAETLALFAVDAHPDLKVRLGHRWVRQCDPRAGGTEGVARLAQKPLGAALLQVAGGHVVEEHIAKHVLRRLVRRNAAAAFADDDGQLALVVEARGVGGLADHIARSNDGGMGLRKHDRSGRPASQLAPYPLAFG